MLDLTYIDYKEERECPSVTVCTLRVKYVYEVLHFSTTKP